MSRVRSLFPWAYSVRLWLHDFCCRICPATHFHMPLHFGRRLTDNLESGLPVASNKGGTMPIVRRIVHTALVASVIALVGSSMAFAQAVIQHTEPNSAPAPY